MNTSKKKLRPGFWIEVIMVICSIIFFVIPFWLVISISITDESLIKSAGFQLWPAQISFEGYKQALAAPDKIAFSYLVTFAQALLGTLLSVVIMALCAYPLSRDVFKPRRVITFLIFFTMLFSGGLIPSYVLNTQFLGLKDNFLIYILPGLVGAWNIIIMRTFFSSLPISLVESAKLDGASELVIFFRIILPLSTPVLATISLLCLLDKWNDWMTSMIYINTESLYTLQYLLQRVLMEQEYLKELASYGVPLDQLDSVKVATESMRYAMAMIAAGPMLFVFPFFQKYFVKGLTVGSVKG